MNSQRQFDRHLAPCAVRQIDGASSEIVGHTRTGIDIVAIIVLSVLGAIHGVGHASPLGIVARTLEAARQETHLALAPRIAHTATNAYTIGCDDAIAIAQVIKHDTVTIVIALVELERAEIHPR